MEKKLAALRGQSLSKLLFDCVIYLGHLKLTMGNFRTLGKVTMDPSPLFQFTRVNCRIGGQFLSNLGMKGKNVGLLCTSVAVQAVYM